MRLQVSVLSYYVDAPETVRGMQRGVADMCSKGYCVIASL